MAEPDNPFVSILRSMDPEKLRATLDKAEALIGQNDRLAASIGELCFAFSGLDRAVTELYCPLLGCSVVQAACVVSENIDPRCRVAIKLLYVEPLPEDWREWVAGLLRRASGELGPARNRYIHDSWRIDEAGATKIDHRVSVAKGQSRQPKEIRYDVEQKSAPEELSKIRDRTSTVTMALHVARLHLEQWRSTGLPPQLDPQWLPASTPKARFVNFQGYQQAPTQPLAPFGYEYD